MLNFYESNGIKNSFSTECADSEVFQVYGRILVSNNAQSNAIVFLFKAFPDFIILIFLEFVTFENEKKTFRLGESE